MKANRPNFNTFADEVDLIVDLIVSMSETASDFVGFVFVVVDVVASVTLVFVVISVCPLFPFGAGVCCAVDDIDSTSFVPVVCTTFPLEDSVCCVIDDIVSGLVVVTFADASSSLNKNCHSNFHGINNHLYVAVTVNGTFRKVPFIDTVFESKY